MDSAVVTETSREGGEWKPGGNRRSAIRTALQSAIDDMKACHAKIQDDQRETRRILADTAKIQAETRRLLDANR